MADIRSIAGTSLVPQAQPVARTEAVRVAQRAFFEAALSGAPSTPAVPARTAAASARQSATTPDRILRPGSIIDIKV